MIQRNGARNTLKRSKSQKASKKKENERYDETSPFEIIRNQKHHTEKGVKEEVKTRRMGGEEKAKPK